MTPSQEDGVWDLETPEERSERVAVGGRRRAGTGVYVQVHEDSEHRRTPSGARAVVRQAFFSAASAGNSFPSTYSRNAPPAVEI